MNSTEKKILPGLEAILNNGKLPEKDLEEVIRLIYGRRLP